MIYDTPIGWQARMCALIIALTLLSGLASASPPALADAFASPPASARPHTWWHWMHGNVTREGITRDIEEMARVGQRGLAAWTETLVFVTFLGQATLSFGRLVTGRARFRHSQEVDRTALWIQIRHRNAVSDLRRDHRRLPPGASLTAARRRHAAGSRGLHPFAG